MFSTGKHINTILIINKTHLQKTLLLLSFTYTYIFIRLLHRHNHGIPQTLIAIKICWQTTCETMVSEPRLSSMGFANITEPWWLLFWEIPTQGNTQTRLSVEHKEKYFSQRERNACKESLRK